MRPNYAIGLTLSTLLATSLITSLWNTTTQSAAQAVELRGQVYFTHPPTLDDAITTQRRTSASGATYYFTLTLPEDAGEPLGRITIAQENGSNSARLVRYRTDNTRAFLGTPRDRGEAITLGETSFDRDSQTVSVTLDPPVSPGQTVTIGVRPVRNPVIDGIYQFGVTAYPAGDNAAGQFIGYGRLTFDQPDSDFPLF